MAHLKKRHRDAIKNLSAEIFIACFCAHNNIPSDGQRRGPKKSDPVKKIWFGYMHSDGIGDHSFAGGFPEIKPAKRPDWYDVQVVGIGNGYKAFSVVFEVYARDASLQLDDTHESNVNFASWDISDKYEYSNTPRITQQLYKVSLYPILAVLVEVIPPAKDQEADELVGFHLKKTGRLL